MAVLLLIGCRSNTSPAAEKITSLPAVDSDISNSPEPAAQPAHWQLGFPLTHDPAKDSIDGRPVSFYLSNPACLPLARAFYTGKKDPRTTIAPARCWTPYAAAAIN